MASINLRAPPPRQPSPPQIHAKSTSKMPSSSTSGTFMHPLPTHISLPRPSRDSPTHISLPRPSRDSPTHISSYITSHARSLSPKTFYQKHHREYEINQEARRAKKEAAQAEESAMNENGSGSTSSEAAVQAARQAAVEKSKAQSP